MSKRTVIVVVLAILLLIAANVLLYRSCNKTSGEIVTDRHVDMLDGQPVESTHSYPANQPPPHNLTVVTPKP